MIFNVTDQQADQIMNALAALPFRDSAPIINELVQQIQKQKQPAMPPPGTPLNGGEATTVVQ